jgi:hypothetical protein
MILAGVQLGYPEPAKIGQVEKAARYLSAHPRVADISVVALEDGVVLQVRAAIVPSGEGVQKDAMFGLVAIMACFQRYASPLYNPAEQNPN